MHADAALPGAAGEVRGVQWFVLADQRHAIDVRGGVYAGASGEGEAACRGSAAAKEGARMSDYVSPIAAILGVAFLAWRALASTRPGARTVAQLIITALYATARWWWCAALGAHAGYDRFQRERRAWAIPEIGAEESGEVEA